MCVSLTGDLLSGHVGRECVCVCVYVCVSLTGNLLSGHVGRGYVHVCTCDVSHFGAHFSLQKRKRSQENIRKKRRRIRLLKKQRIWARKALSKTTTTPPDTPSSFSQNELLT